VIDSVDALVEIPRAEIEAKMGDTTRPAGSIDEPGLRKSTGADQQEQVHRISSTRSRKDRVMYGSPETTHGGRALKFYASIARRPPPPASIKEGEVHTGNRTRAPAW